MECTNLLPKQMTPYPHSAENMNDRNVSKDSFMYQWQEFCGAGEGSKVMAGAVAKPPLTVRNINNLRDSFG